MAMQRHHAHHTHALDFRFHSPTASNAGARMTALRAVVKTSDTRYHVNTRNEPLSSDGLSACTNARPASLVQPHGAPPAGTAGATGAPPPL